jgi:hypothetical protein
MQTVQYVRVINGQTTFGNSVLLDKIDRTSGQFETDLTYAQTGKQKVYVPYVNPLDPTVPGYIDMIPTDEVLLQLYQPQGVINQLAARGVVSYVLHHASAVATPVVSGSVHGAATGQAGTAGQFTTAASGGTANFADAIAGAFLAGDVNKFVTVSGSIHAVDNGTFRITAHVDADDDTVANAAAVIDTAVDVWSISSGTTIAGTTFVSVTPDHTYVTITNNTTHVAITLTDTAIIAAGGTVSATGINIPNTLITNGPPAAGFLVQVQANSKKSNVFTMT